MKKTKIVIFSMVLAFTLGLMGCRTEPVYTVEESPITVNGQASLKSIKKAIIGAGAGLGWIMKEVKPGHIVGTLNIRKHMAKVDIPYSTSSYNITYNDSHELKYDGEMIHANYNGWVQNLDRAIQARLSAL